MGLRENHAFTNERYSQWPVLRRSRNAFRRDRWPLTMFSGKISMQVVAHVISAYWPHDGKYLRKSDFPNAVSFSTTQKPGRYGDCCFLAKPLFSNCHTRTSRMTNSLVSPSLSLESRFPVIKNVARTERDHVIAEYSNGQPSICPVSFSQIFQNLKQIHFCQAGFRIV